MGWELAIPLVTGIIGGKGGGDRQEVTPQQMPSYPGELAGSMELFGPIMEEFLGDPGLLEPSMGLEEMDFGPTDIGEAGQFALTDLRGFKPGYDVLPEEAMATGWLEDLFGGGVGGRAREALGGIDRSAMDLGEQLLRGSEARTSAQYARGGQLYGAAPIAQRTEAARKMGTELATGSAQRASALEQALLGMKQRGAGQLAGIAGQRGQRGIGAAQARLGALREELSTGALQSQLRSEAARRKQGEIIRREDRPLDILSQIGRLLAGFQPGQTYWPQTEPSGFAQAFGAAGEAAPGIMDAVLGILGGGKGGGGGTEGAATGGGRRVPPAIV